VLPIAAVLYAEQAGLWQLPPALGLSHILAQSTRSMLVAAFAVWLCGGPLLVSLAITALDLALIFATHLHKGWRCHGQTLGMLNPPGEGGTGVVLITGASSGIGKDCAFAFAARGWSVVLVARTKSALEAVKEEIERRCPKVTAHVLPADLSDPTAAVDTIEATCQKLSLEIHVLVNNAGLDMAGSFVSKDEADLAQLIAVNCTAPTLLTRRIIPLMVARGFGRVCFVSSLVSVSPVPGHCVYAASKALLSSLADSVRYELEGTGVGVVNVLAGAVNTGFFQASGMAATTPVFSVPGYALRSERVADEITKAVLEGRTETVVTGVINQMYASIFPVLFPRRFMMLVAERAMAPVEAPWRVPPPAVHAHAD